MPSYSLPRVSTAQDYREATGRIYELSLILEVWDTWITSGLQRGYSNVVGPFCFLVGVCHAKGESLFLFFFFFFTSRGINILWRGDGLVFLKCLLCYYCSKKEISSALSGGSHTSLGGQRDIVFPFLNSRHTARRKS